MVCGQQPIAPCPNVLNSGSVAAPSSECAYFMKYGIDSTKFIPSLNPTCLASLNTGGTSCIAECQPLYALYGRCFYYGRLPSLLDLRRVRQSKLFMALWKFKWNSLFAFSLLQFYLLLTFLPRCHRRCREIWRLLLCRVPQWSKGVVWTAAHSSLFYHSEQWL